MAAKTYTAKYNPLPVDLKIAREQKAWLKDKLRLLPSAWAARVERRYWNLNKRFERPLEANIFVRKLTDKLSVDIDIGASDDAIKELASYNAKHIESALWSIGACGQTKFIELMQGICERYDVRYPAEHELEGITARLIDAAWWLRTLRMSHARARERACIEAGLVHKRASLYCSDDTLLTRKDQRARNESMLENITIENQSGTRLTLADAAAAGMANTNNRVNELITRCRGFQDLANEYQHHCVFVTITAPSRFHPMRANGSANKNYDHVNQPMPIDTQKYLTKQWARCRAVLAHHEVKFYGLRVVEPHHDGTPHWHMAIWYKDKTDFYAIRSAIKNAFLRAPECDYHERGAIQNRLKFKQCDSRGAVGYMLKYIVKNMRGHGIENENDTESGQKISSESSAERVEAWAAVWRIRQFQQIGGHSVSVWRELRRVGEDGLKVAYESEEGVGKFKELIEMYWHVQRVGKKNADFAAYIKSMGGLGVRPKDSRFKLDDEYQYTDDGKYGRAIVHKIYGVIDRLNESVRLASMRGSWSRVVDAAKEKVQKPAVADYRVMWGL